MAIQLQLRRGTTIENNTFTGALGEVTMDTDKNNLRLHDGSTLGGVVIDKADDVVHKTGSEIITGEKTFFGGTVTRFRDINYNIGTFSSDQWSTSNLLFTDRSGTRIGRIQPSYITGTNITQMGIWASNGSGTGSTEYGLIVRSNGEALAPRPIVSNSTTLDYIATTGWVNDPTASTNVVHRTGDETIRGVKTFIRDSSFNRSESIVFKNNYLQQLVAPSEFSEQMVYGVDKDGNRIGSFGIGMDTNANSMSYISASKTINGQTVFSTIYTYVDTNGNTWAIAPTPGVGTTGNNIATCDYLINILKIIYPVGSIYIGTQNTCPMSVVIPGSTWELVAQDRALWGGNGSNGNSTIEAGLPNITGTIGGRINTLESPTSSGAFTTTYNVQNALDYNEDNSWTANFDFNASRSSPIYGNSNTVQPPAYRVNVWRRTA